jgi:hypothetical protein
VSERDGKERPKDRSNSGHRDWSWFPADFFNGFAVSDASAAILLVILILAGTAVLVYFVAIVLANILSFGEVHKASVYCKKARMYSIDETSGCEQARNLTRMNLYFSIVLFIFTAEEVIRYVLHTGTATIEIWYFRFTCLVIFAVILAIFLVRLRRWIIFQSDPAFMNASKEIKRQEDRRRAMYEPRSPT